MKRNRDASGPSSSSSRGPKRSKSVQACASCRKHKTRCEILDGLDQEKIRCHRCKVLEVQCSYQDMDRSIFEAAQGIGPKETETVRTLEQALNARGRHEESSIAGTSFTSSSSQNTPGCLPGHIHPDTFVQKPHTIWEFLQLPTGRLDWSAPFEAIHELSKHSLNSARPMIPVLPPVPNDSLENIITHDEIDRLLEIFTQKYSPWLSFTPIRETHNPLLDLVCCTIASRHLDEATRSLVAPRLQNVTEDAIAKIIFQSRRSKSLESIQALLILSLWAPVCGAAEDFRDGRLLIASAVSMALNMRLNDAFDQMTALRLAREKGEPINETEWFDTLNRTRLWLALTNAESMLCIGSGRNALSKRSTSYLKIFPLSANLPSDLYTGRDLRLRLMGELFDFTEAAMGMQLRSLDPQDLEVWYDGFSHVFANLSRVQRLILPLGVVADFDQFYFSMLNITMRSCRLLVLYHASFTARMHFIKTGDCNPFWFREVRPRGLSILVSWGKEALQIAEAVMVTLLEMDTRLLGTAPDHIFTMVGFAASYIVGSKFLVAQGFGTELPGSSEKLLCKSMTHLNTAACSPDSAPRRCAALIEAMVGSWQEKVATMFRNGQNVVGYVPCPHSHDPPTHTPPLSSTPSDSPTSSYTYAPSQRPTPEHTLPTQHHPVSAPSQRLTPEHTLPTQHQPLSGAQPTSADMYWLNPDFFQQAAFWSELFEDNSYQPTQQILLPQ